MLVLGSEYFLFVGGVHIEMLSCVWRCVCT